MRRSPLASTVKCTGCAACCARTACLGVSGGPPPPPCPTRSPTRRATAAIAARGIRRRRRCIAEAGGRVGLRGLSGRRVIVRILAYGATAGSGRITSAVMEAATEQRAHAARTEQPSSSFAKSLFLGEIHEELVFPWPQPDPDEQDRVKALIATAQELGSHLDP